MVLKRGYSRNTIERNIKEYIEDDGLDEERAKKAALKFARKCFVKQFPDKELPDYLEEL